MSELLRLSLNRQFSLLYHRVRWDLETRFDNRVKWYPMHIIGFASNDDLMHLRGYINVLNKYKPHHIQTDDTQ